MKKFVGLVIVFVAFYSNSCINTKNAPHSLHELDFKLQTKVQENRIETNEMLNIRQFIVQDTLIIINNSRDDSIFMVLNLNTSEIIRSWGVRGRGPEEYGVWTHLMSVTNENFQVADFTMNRIETYSIPDFDLTENRKIIKHGNAERLEIPQRISTMDGNHFFYDNFSENKLSIKQIEIGETPVEINHFCHLRDLFPSPWFYLGNLVLNRHEQKIVYAYRYLRKFDIMNLEGEIIKTVEVAPMPISPIKRGNNIDLEKSVMCYMGATGNDHSFYLLYIGRSAEEVILNDYKLSCFIEEYDWDGNPIRRYEINRFVSDFALLSNEDEAQSISFLGIDVTNENPLIVFKVEIHE
ncbi:BF3164 family lipoprotein [Alkalitalea saponilacus]|uniref:TolB-like 6-blade propeller-like n=1 Tax=Alkalitalea saponilacus TaxID=889453 RepID=A0A1T5EXX3_9BACT|nr:hypothetical protein [Alkalitalea saponilacus]ASB47975.1 hypothetical protein CDL62_01805 [Alkalitalea saponilacus]SKB88792.1 hypothetical protein SAMN03080601_01454 [Alkalitalea saponilacus]